MEFLTQKLLEICNFTELMLHCLLFYMIILPRLCQIRQLFQLQFLISLRTIYLGYEV